MKKLIRRLCCIVLMLTFIVNDCTAINAEETIDTVQAVEREYYIGGTPIMGATTVTLAQMINYYQANEVYPSFYANSDAPTIYAFCKIFMEECNAEGVRTEVAFAQAMKETGFLRYRGDVNISQYNFAGIGATGGGNPGYSFPNVRMGVRAQVQHLKAYATKEPLKQGMVDPRYNLVNKGSAPYVEWLGKHENPTGIGWATAYGYGISIVNDYINKLKGYSSYSTWYQGINYETIYDPEYYMINNPDVAQIFGGSSEGLLWHFVNCGMSEGRKAKDTFDICSYKQRYKDLRTAYGSDLKAYYLHYMNYGYKEGRIANGTVESIDGVTVYNGIDYSTVYDYNFYINNNPDIREAFGTDDIATLQHFVNYGMQEGRLAKRKFNVYSYKQRYKDLRMAYGYDWKVYYLHYMNYGCREGRIADGVVNEIDGVTVYDGIDYSAVYDYNYYINNNPDIKAAFGMDDIATLQHFVTYGMSEGRKAKETFDVGKYRSKYDDLEQAYGDNWKAYYEHYINFGIVEGRSTF